MPDVILALSLLVLIVAGGLGGLFAAYRKLREGHQRLAAELSARKTDLTDAQARQRSDEDALRRSEEWIRILVSNTRDLVLVYGIGSDGLPGKFLRVNDIACSQLGYDHDKLLTMGPLDIEASDAGATVSRYSRMHDAETTAQTIASLASDDVLSYESSLAARRFIRNLIVKKQTTYEHEYVAAGGRRFPVEINAQYFELFGEPIVMCLARDITDRREAEQAVRESERRFRGFFAYSPIGIAIYDAERKIVDVNRACLKMYGSPDVDAFKRYDMFKHPFAGEDVQEKIDRGESVRYEASIDFDGARNRGLMITSRSGRAHFDILLTNLGSDENFKPKGYLIQVQDITGRREAEEALSQSESQLRQAQKMEAIGTLAGGIAHDFNNILTPILGYTEMALDQTPSDSRAKGYLSEVVKASLRAKELANQILTFSRRTESEGKPLCVAPVLKEVLALQRAALPNSIEIRETIKTEKDVIIGNATQLHQVLMNLCTNSAHAMRIKERGLLEVVMTDFLLEARARSDFPNLHPGRYLRISIKDNGAGMARETTERIFEPFFTTKKRGEGTGMGLAVAHGIVTGLKGTITVDTQLGEGSTFHVMLPVLEKMPVEEVAKAANLPMGYERVLFVDDEPDIVVMEAEMLTSLGYQPLTATRGRDALQIFRRNPKGFDIVITDMVMPGMTGTELAQQILDIRPDIPVLLCTGFSERVSKEQASAVGVREILLKPVERRDMAKAIRRSLDAPDNRRPAPSLTQ